MHTCIITIQPIKICKCNFSEKKLFPFVAPEKDLAVKNI